MHLFGYLKKHPNHCIVLNSAPLECDDGVLISSFDPNSLEDYLDAKEEIDPSLPTPYGFELETSTDHAHDHVTCCSITGLILFVGSTPVHWISKCQGCIATSTYCAEFVAMCSAVEEAIVLCYMLQYLGIPVSSPNHLFGDNFGVIQSVTICQE